MVTMTAIEFATCLASLPASHSFCRACLGGGCYFKPYFKAEEIGNQCTEKLPPVICLARSVATRQREKQSGFEAKQLYTVVKYTHLYGSPFPRLHIGGSRNQSRDSLSSVPSWSPHSGFGLRVWEGFTVACVPAKLLQPCTTHGLSPIGTPQLLYLTENGFWEDLKS